MEVLDGVLRWLVNTFFLPPLILIIVVIAVIKLPKFIVSRHFKAGAGEALVETGGKKQKPKVYIAGSKFVSPWHECKIFPLGNLQIVSADERSAPTFTQVPVKVKWSAWIRADRRSVAEKQQTRDKAYAEATAKREVLLKDETLDEVQKLARQKEIALLDFEIAEIEKINELPMQSESMTASPDIIPDGLQRAIIGYSHKIGENRNDTSDYQQLINELRTTLDAKVREVIASMTPEQLLTDRSMLNASSRKSAAPTFELLGFELLDFSINEVNDGTEKIEEYDSEGKITRSRGYFDNLSAADEEEHRRAARVLTAAKEEEAVIAEIEKEINVAEKNRELVLKKADVQEKTAEAKSRADYAEKIRNQEQEITLTQKQAEVAIAQEEKNRQTAEKAREVALTKAETEKQQKLIEAEAAKERQIVEARAKAEQDKINAEAQAEVKAKEAKGEADAARQKASGEADAKNTLAEAQAAYTLKTERAQAEGKKAVLLAEAEGQKAKLLAEAEGQKAMSDALSSNDGILLQVETLKIKTSADVEIAASQAQIVANVGEKTTVIDWGNGESGRRGGLLGDLLGDIPRWLKAMNVENEVLNGTPFAAALSELSAAIQNKESAYKPVAIDSVAPVEDTSKVVPEEIPFFDSGLPDSAVRIVPAEVDEPDSIETVVPETVDQPAEEVMVDQPELLADQPNESEPLVDESDEPFGGEIPAEEDPILVADTEFLAADVVKQAKLDKTEAYERAQVVAWLKAQGGYETDLETLTKISAQAIKALRADGKSVTPREIAKTILDTDSDGSATSIEATDALGSLVKRITAQRKRKRR